VSALTAIGDNRRCRREHEIGALEPRATKQWEFRQIQSRANTLWRLLAKGGKSKQMALVVL
jgi:hypothetical protein